MSFYIPFLESCVPALFCALLVAGWTAAAIAQRVDGTIRVEVRRPSGTVIPGAPVSAQNFLNAGQFTGGRRIVQYSPKFVYSEDVTEL
jgi:hypothetical protein